MRVVIAGRAAEFDENGACAKLLDLPLQAGFKNPHFLAERGRRRRLTVSTRQHRDGGMRDSTGIETGADVFEGRQNDRLKGAAKGDAVGNAVDVFGGEREVGPFGDIFKRGLRKPHLDEILNGFHVVIGGRNSLKAFAFDFLHKACVCRRDLGKLSQKGLFLIAQLSHSHARFGERDEVFGLNKQGAPG